MQKRYFTGKEFEAERDRTSCLGNTAIKKKKKKKTGSEPVQVAHTCNPSYSGGKD
jgi:hypothetical protein